MNEPLIQQSALSSIHMRSPTVDFDGDTPPELTDNAKNYLNAHIGLDQCQQALARIQHGADKGVTCKVYSEDDLAIAVEAFFKKVDPCGDGTEFVWFTLRTNGGLYASWPLSGLTSIDSECISNDPKVRKACKQIYRRGTIKSICVRGRVLSTTDYFNWI